jgi:hypothetical protein
MRQIVRKVICVLFVLFSSSAVIYGANTKNFALNIQGSGPPASVEGFKYALTIEAEAAGYRTTDNLASAKYYIKFNVEFDQAGQGSRFIVSLLKVADSSEIVTMEYYFADEEEMLLYSQLVFFMLMANLPEEDSIAAASPAESDNWRNKWLYARGSLDYSVSMLGLKSDGLIGNAGVYYGAYDDPTRIAPLDNTVVLMPGMSLGAEFQFFDWMSIEPGVHLSLEEILLKNYMYNMLFSLELKFPLKFFKNFILAPYGAGSYPMRFPQENEIFDNYPMLGYGGGIQTSVKAGKNSAVFLDINYMYFGDTGMNNRYGELFPNPSVIHYNQSALGIRIGYKHGFFDRKSTTPP